jgi:tripartite ATP-independent transporter DctM subunit
MAFNIALGVAGLAAMLFLIFLRVPIAFSMLLVGFVGTAALSGTRVAFAYLKTLPYAQFSIYDLSVIPMFVLMGCLASRSGLSRDLFHGANAWMGRFRGGVAMAAIAACAGFGAVCGSSLATASTMGQVALPELRRLRYAPSLATGALAAGGTLGILIPPSVVLIVYAIIIEANIVTLFMAALVPGLIAVVLFIITIAIYVAFRPEAGPVAERVSSRELFDATLGILPVIVIFGVVIGGIYGGLYNPTPAAAIGVFLVAAHGYALRRLSWKHSIEAVLETARTTGMIYLILLGAAFLSIFMSRAGVPQAVASLLHSSGFAPLTILILIIAVYLILGCLMDSLSMIILATPFFWPVIAGLDFGMSVDDLKIWYGIITLVVVELGLITPPVGLNVFIINSLAPDIPMRETFKGVAPFFASEIVRVTLLVAFPAITLALPHFLS